MTLKIPGCLIAATLLPLVLASGCKSAEPHPDQGRIVSFVHITDPHLFLDTAQPSAGAEAATPAVPGKVDRPSIKKTDPTEIGKTQEGLDHEALAAAWKSIPSLAKNGHPFSFVLITGDFGIDPCPIVVPALAKAAPAKDCIDKSKLNEIDRNKEVENLAEALEASPIRDIYLVPGNNDLPRETASDEGLVYFNRFMDDVQRKIDSDGKNVRLYNLNRCYVDKSDLSSCYADVAETSYRLIGFPSYSYKNSEKEPEFGLNPPLQEKQFETFRTLLNQARAAGKKTLIVTHIPLMDDPYTMGQVQFAKAIPPTAAKDADPSRSPSSAWNVSKEVTDGWQQAVADDSVIAVLAGHLHDPHKEIYRRPFSWSSVNDPKNGFTKLYLAPPLSVKKQDTSILQARGLAVMSLMPERVSYRIYWFNAKDGTFTPDGGSDTAVNTVRGETRHWWQPIPQGITWLWQLGTASQSIDRMAVLLIALLAAFLTVVQVWQIPVPDNPLQTRNPPPDAPTGSAAGTKPAGGPTPPAKPAFDPSPFASNFGKTIITGLGGLAAAVLVKSVDSSSKPLDNEFYFVWFILFFFAILILLAGLRAFGEAIRERLAIAHPKTDAGAVSRFAQWLLSLRFSALTFLDTFMNLIQGKNQTLTRVFSDTIVNQQRNVVRVTEVLRQQLNDLILHQLNTPPAVRHGARAEARPRELRDPRDVRVNISLLSEDGSNVYYIARTPGSSYRIFPKHSVAWVCVFASKIRWYKTSWHNAESEFKDIILYANGNGFIPGGEVDLKLASYYQAREDDYEAFVIFPVPWPERAFGSGFVRGAVHISFRHQDDFEEIWAINETDDPGSDSNEKKTYGHEDEMLGRWCTDPEIKTSLRQSIATLSQLLCGFNDDIYKYSRKAGDGC
jgi:hypothetical protein